jgi:hypothetical protein
LAYPPKTKTTYETNKENIITEEIDEIIQIRDSELETLDLITIPTERNEQSSMIYPKNTENKNEQKDPIAKLITYALDGNKATSLIDMNNRMQMDDNKLTINIKDITYEVHFEINKLDNKEEYHSGNRNVPNTDIPTKKRIQGNKCKPNDINTQPISSVLENQVSESNNDMKLLITRNITYEMYKTNKHCAEPTEKLIRITEIPTPSAGNYLFDSLIITCNLKMTAKELRRQLLNSTVLGQYEYAEESQRKVRNTETMTSYNEILNALNYMGNYKS